MRLDRLYQHEFLQKYPVLPLRYQKPPAQFHKRQLREVELQDYPIAEKHSAHTQK